MKSILAATAFLFTAVTMMSAEKRITSPHGTFSIRQEFADDCWKEVLEFRDTAKAPTHLEGYPWPGFYSISPDERWTLRIQKTGSGDNIGILYRIEETGRVSVVLGFDDALWAISDRHARLQKKMLYHTAITTADWDMPAGTLAIGLHGSNAEKSGDGIEVQVAYDLKTHGFKFIKGG